MRTARPVQLFMLMREGVPPILQHAGYFYFYLYFFFLILRSP